MADQKELEEQVRQLTTELERLNRVSSSLGSTLGDALPRSLRGTVEKKFADGVVKMLGNVARKAEEEAVKNARKAGATEQEALGVRLATRRTHEQAAIKGLQELGAAATKLGGQLYKGMEGMSGFAQATDSGISAVAKFAATIGGPVAKAVSLLAMGLSKYAMAAVAQSDKLYKAHKDMAQSGAAASDGIQGVYDMMQQFSLGSDELNKMTSMIAANSQSLAMFQGTVALGARALGKISGEIKNSGLREQFLAMGISVDEQREAAAGYLAIQTRLGRVQQQDTKALSASIGEYIKETDAITKLTGAGRKEQEAARDKAMQMEQFRAHIMELEAQGTTESIARAKTLQEAMAKAGTMKGGAFVQEQIAASVTGFITKATVAGQLATGGELTRIATDINLNSDQIVEQAGIAIDKSTKVGSTFFDIAKMGALKDAIGVDFDGLRNFAEASKNLGARSQEVANEQGRMTKNLEAATSAQVKGEIANLDTRASLQGFVQMGVLPATEAMSGFARGVAAVTSMLPQTAVGKKADARTTVGRIYNRADPKYTGPGSKNLMGTPTGTPGVPAAVGTSGPGVTPETAAQIQAAKDYAREITVAPGTPGTPAAAAPASIDSGPVFSSANKVQVTLIEIRDEIKKLVRMGAVPGGGGGTAAAGQAQVQAALVEHDHAHPHPPSADVSPELAAKIGALVNPLEKMNQTSGFIRNDGKTMHGAVDLAGKIGDKVMAPISGLAKVLSDPKGYGNYVEVTDTITGVKHILAHLDKTMIKTGDMVKAGQQVGTVGNTGRSTGAHLHHEIKLPDGTRVDPSKFYAGAARRPGAPAMAGAPGDLGSLSQKYESGTAGSMAVGRDRSGGTSYGKYQIASKVGSMDAFLKLLQKNDPEAYSRLMAAGPQDAGTQGNFAQEWKKLASEGRVQKSEKEFAVDKIFQPAMKGLKDQDLSRMISSNKGLQEMMFSMAIQHGGAGAPAILNKVFKKGMSAEQLTEAAYAERGADDGKRYFGKSTEGERAGVVSRFGREKQDVLAMLGNPNMAGPSSVPTPVATAPGTTAALPAGPATTAQTQPAQPSTVAQQNSLMLQQLVTLNQQQNTLLGKILQTSQA